MEFLSQSLKDTKQFAAEFVARISENPRDSATVVGLYGNLGSGKTTFVQCVGEILNVAEHITSPTFLIVKSYRPARPQPDRIVLAGNSHSGRLQVTSFKKLIHIDGYRLKSGEELRKLGFGELLRNPDNLILIEWADLVADILPANHIKLSFEFVDEKTRKITTEYWTSGVYR